MLVNDVLQDMLNQFGCVHPDDIRDVCCHFLDNSLFVKSEKSEFRVSLVSFPGYMISKDPLEIVPVEVLVVPLWNNHRHT